MGANFVVERLSGDLTNAQLIKQFKAIQTNCRHENGHSYSGQIGMAPGLTIETKIFNSYDEAEEYLIANCQKWENAIAVRYKPEILAKPLEYLIGAICSC